MGKSAIDQIEYMVSLSTKKEIEAGSGKVVIGSSVHPNDKGQMTAVKYTARHTDGRQWEFWGDNPGGLFRSLGYTIEYTQ